MSEGRPDPEPTRREPLDPEQRDRDVAELTHRVDELAKAVKRLERGRATEKGRTLRRVRAILRIASWATRPTLSRLRLLEAYLVIGRSGEFDRAFYLAAYRDVARAHADPLAHYVEYGWREGRDPSPRFSTRDYLEQRPDVASEETNPLLHYIRYATRSSPAALTGAPGPEALAADETVPPAVGQTVLGGVSPVRRSSQAGSERAKASVVCWDMGHNPLGRAYLLAEALSRSFDVEIVGAQFPRYGKQVWAPLRDSPISKRTFAGTDFPEHFTRMEDVAGQLSGDVIVASKPRLPSYELSILAKEAANRPLVLDVDDRELAFFSESTGLTLSEANANRSDPDFLLPFGRTWTRYCESIIGAADAVTVSNPELGQLYGGTVIPHARDERVFDPALYDRDAVRARFGLAPADRVLLFVGTPRPHKGILELVDAVAAMPDSRYKLCVVGTASDRQVAGRLEEMDRDRVVLVGDRPMSELAETMMVGDLVCLLQDATSEIARHQMPAKFTDALAMGVPMLCNPTPPLAGPISRGLVEEVRPGSLRDQIANVFDHLPERRNAALENRRVFLEEYSHAAVSRTLADEIERLRGNSMPLNGDHADLLAFHRSTFRSHRTAPKRAPASITSPRRPRSRRRVEDPLDIVFFWKQNDSGIYGRRSDMMVKYLAASDRVRQIVQFDAPMDSATLVGHLLRGRDRFQHDDLVFKNTIRRAVRPQTRGKVKQHVFLHRGQGGPGLAGLPLPGIPSGQRYPDYVSRILDQYGVGHSATSVFWVCPVNYDFPDLARALEPDLVVADVIDDERAFRDPYSAEIPLLTENYRETLGISDVVLANCQPVQEAMQGLADPIHVVPNACEPPVATSAPVELPSELRGFTGPLIGYVGNLSSRIDHELLDFVARSRPDWNLVFLGSAHLSQSVLRLANHPNVHFLGVKPYSVVRSYVSAFDVAIVPHVDDALTQSMNPLKVFVYAAAGVPIVSTQVGNLDELGELVAVASTPADFVAAIEAALVADRGLTDEARALIGHHTWPRRVDTVLDLLDDIGHPST